MYAIYVLDPRDQRLLHVVSLREVMLAEPGPRRSTEVGESGRRRHRAARYGPRGRGPADLQVQPARHAGGGRRRPRARHRHGGRRDRRARQRADRGRAEVRRHGGAGRAVHGDRLRRDDPEARRLALRALPGRDAHRDGDGALRGRDRAGRSCWRCSSRSSSARAATPARRPRRSSSARMALREVHAARLVAGGAARAAGRARAGRHPGRDRRSCGSCSGSALGWYDYGAALSAGGAHGGRCRWSAS